ncbi:MAG: hypothetical protein MZU97_18840 [Bacillus subtilis]|nr:hypothetical protein [Bacillus subtilis]
MNRPVSVNHQAVDLPGPVPHQAEDAALRPAALQIAQLVEAEEAIPSRYSASLPFPRASRRAASVLFSTARKSISFGYLVMSWPYRSRDSRRSSTWARARGFFFQDTVQGAFLGLQERQAS